MLGWQEMIGCGTMGSGVLGCLMVGCEILGCWVMQFGLMNFGVMDCRCWCSDCQLESIQGRPPLKGRPRAGVGCEGAGYPGYCVLGGTYFSLRRSWEGIPLSIAACRWRL